MQAVARRYASALADVVTARGEAREVRDELTAWERMASESPQLLEVFRNPTIPYEQKRRVVGALITRTRVRPSTANFLQVLLQNHRLADLPEIIRQFAHELDRRTGAVSAEVTTARPVPEAAQSQLRARLSALTGKDVRLQFQIDEGLIGGVVTRIGSTVYDGSVRNQLRQVKEKMIGDRA
ncbi:MAG TPA: ATP synthase F1 subunit delta [Pyrinomonadaceae bacterium]|nr:ATP synthase F1 subunit delta [Pyrinomonadaceae bacterium]